MPFNHTCWMGWPVPPYRNVWVPLLLPCFLFFAPAWSLRPSAMAWARYWFGWDLSSCQVIHPSRKASTFCTLAFIRDASWLLLAICDIKYFKALSNPSLITGFANIQWFDRHWYLEFDGPMDCWDPSWPLLVCAILDCKSWSRSRLALFASPGDDGDEIASNFLEAWPQLFHLLEEKKQRGTKETIPWWMNLGKMVTHWRYQSSETAATRRHGNYHWLESP